MKSDVHIVGAKKTRINFDQGGGSSKTGNSIILLIGKIKYVAFYSAGIHLISIARYFSK